MSEQDHKTTRLAIFVGAVVLAWLGWCMVSCSQHDADSTARWQDGYTRGLTQKVEK